MASKETNLYALFAEVNKLGQNGEYERALKTANKSMLHIFSTFSALEQNEQNRTI